MNGTLSTTESPQPKQLLVPEESTARAAAADVIVAAPLDVLGACARTRLAGEPDCTHANGYEPDDAFERGGVESIAAMVRLTSTHQVSTQGDTKQAGDLPTYQGDGARRALVGVDSAYRDVFALDFGPDALA